MAENKKRWIWLLLCAALAGFICGTEINHKQEVSAQEIADTSTVEAAQRQSPLNRFRITGSANSAIIRSRNILNARQGALALDG